MARITAGFDAFRWASIVMFPDTPGKSLVAAGGHFAAYARGERTYYTAPIKALVSEIVSSRVASSGDGDDDETHHVRHSGGGGGRHYRGGGGGGGPGVFFGHMMGGLFGRR